MSPDPRPAAFRLKHDLGKYVRWSAPERRETDVEALRARLRRDLRETRATPEGTRSAAEVFDAWRREDEEAFASHPDLKGLLAEIAAAVEEIRTALPALDVLDARDLERLDETTLALSRAAAALHRRTVTG